MNSCNEAALRKDAQQLLFREAEFFMEVIITRGRFLREDSGEFSRKRVAH